MKLITNAAKKRKYSVSAAAQRGGFDEGHVTREIDRGVLIATTSKGRQYIDEDELERYLTSTKEAQLTLSEAASG